MIIFDQLKTTLCSTIPVQFISATFGLIGNIPDK